MTHATRQIGRPAALATALSLAIGTTPAGAAVAECFQEMTGKLAEARTEQEARKAALDDWLDKAAAIGPGYTRWQIAYNRRIDCARSAAGQYQCQAIAMPCTIKQVPNPDVKTLKRGVPPQ